MTSCRFSGSSLVDNSVESARSQNISVRGRRSASFESKAALPAAVVEAGSPLCSSVSVRSLVRVGVIGESVIDGIGAPAAGRPPAQTRNAPSRSTAQRRTTISSWRNASSFASSKSISSFSDWYEICCSFNRRQMIFLQSGPNVHPFGLSWWGKQTENQSTFCASQRSTVISFGV